MRKVVSQSFAYEGVHFTKEKNMKMERGVESNTQRAEGEDSSSFHGVRRKKMKSNKRRFSDEQIRSLEEKFEEETKLEPQKKVQLARDLGLQPRQVSIWFQNRRARWKSKQLEREYSALRADYDALASSFQSLKEEKECLLEQVYIYVYISSSSD